MFQYCNPCVVTHPAVSTAEACLAKLSVPYLLMLVAVVAPFP